MLHWNFLQRKRCGTSETLTPQNVVYEELMLGLRQKRGIDLQRMIYFLKEDERLIKERIFKLKEKNLIQEKNNKISLTTRGIILADEVILNLI